MSKLKRYIPNIATDGSVKVNIELTIKHEQEPMYLRDLARMLSNDRGNLMLFLGEDLLDKMETPVQKRTTYIPKRDKFIPIPHPENCHALTELELMIRKLVNTVPQPNMMHHDEICGLGHYSTDDNYWYWDLYTINKSPEAHIRKACKVLGLLS